MVGLFAASRANGLVAALATCFGLLFLASTAEAGTVPLQAGATAGTAKTPDGSASFDLHALRSNKYYHASTSGSVRVDSRYSYMFNIGGNVTSPSSLLCGELPAPAFQIKPVIGLGPVTQCKRLADNPDHAEWTLLNDQDPSKGVSIRYLGGATCSHSTPPNQPRTFTVNFICADTSKGVDPADGASTNEIDAPVDEGDDSQRCHYEVEFVTRHACPTQCPISQTGLLCHGGFCGYDSSIAAPRCFCQRGWYGSDCSETSRPSGQCTGLCLILAFLIALLSILLVAGSLVYWKVHTIVAKQRQMGLSQSAPGGEGKGKAASSASDRLQLSLGPDSAADDEQSGLPGGDVAMAVMPGSHSRQQQQHLEEIELEDDEDELRDL